MFNPERIPALLPSGRGFQSPEISHRARFIQRLPVIGHGSSHGSARCRGLFLPRRTGTASLTSGCPRRECRRGSCTSNHEEASRRATDSGSVSSDTESKGRFRTRFICWRIKHAELSTRERVTLCRAAGNSREDLRSEGGNEPASLATVDVRRGFLPGELGSGDPINQSPGRFQRRAVKAGPAGARALPNHSGRSEHGHRKGVFGLDPGGRFHSERTI